jgi:hypothetical protein
MRSTLLAVLLVGVASGLAVAETISITLPQDKITLAPGPGADVAQTQCAFCHSLEYITMQPKGPVAQWQGVVTKMIKMFGAPISDANAKVITEYLSTRYAP